MRYVIDLLLGIGVIATSPVWIYRMIRHGRYRSNCAQRFGLAPRTFGLQPVIWIHAVSAGEINAARPIVKEIHSQLPDYRVVISSTTDTGLQAARTLFGKDHTVFAWCMDFSLSVRSALKRVRPALVVLMEGECWPNFLAECSRRGVPVVLVNGRMSPDKGYRRYKLLGSLAGKLLFNRLSAVGVQDESYAGRFRALGTDAGRICVTGMIKFDVPVTDSVEGQQQLAEAVGVDQNDRLVVAGSTGPGEEQIALDVFEKLRPRHQGLRLAIIPRKPERFDEVARLIRSRGYELARRSERPDGCTAPSDRQAVILGDTMGELRKFYALAECIFVGRSLVAMGGSDMIEAAARGKAVAFGPHTINFPQADELARHGCARVADATELEGVLDGWLGDREQARSAGRSVQDYIRPQQGAARRNVEMICRVLGRTPAVRPGGIATVRLDNQAMQAGAE